MAGFDELWPSGPRFKQTEQSFKLSTDSVLLADFAGGFKARRALDLGSGAGVLCVLLGWNDPNMEIAGVELQPAFAELGRENLAENGLKNAGIINADLREHRELFSAESFDLVVSNPPYFPENSGYSAPTGHRAAAREERNCTLADICAAAKWALRWGGSMAIVHRPERLSELFCAMSAAGIEPKRLRMVCHRAEKAPSLVLVEGRRGGKPGLVIEKPLVLTEADGTDTQEIQKIYRRGSFAPTLQE